MFKASCEYSAKLYMLRPLQNPICGAFLRCVLLARLPIYLICLRSLRCYALNCIHI